MKKRRKQIGAHTRKEYSNTKTMKRLYVLVNKKLAPIYGCVQGGHAVAQFMLENPKQDWNNNFLIYFLKT